MTESSQDGCCLWLLLVLLGPLMAEAGSQMSGCVFPSLYRHQAIHECQRQSSQHSGKWWCPLDDNYDSYRTWRLCPDTKKTEGGNDPGRPCHLPFLVGARPVYTCLRRQVSGAKLSETYWWCATTEDFDRDGLWTRCRRQSNELPCVFPAAVSKMATKAIARMDARCHRFQGDLVCRTEPNEVRLCPATPGTIGGNDPGRPCHFPFIFRQREYSACLVHPRPLARGSNGSTASGHSIGYNEDPEDSLQPWCATTAQFDQEPRWTYCQRSGWLRLLHSVPHMLLLLCIVGAIIPLLCGLRFIRRRLRERDWQPNTV